MISVRDILLLIIITDAFTCKKNFNVVVGAIVFLHTVKEFNLLCNNA